MLLITCPYCGSRDESEFTCGGEAHIARPEHPESLSDSEWAEYLFMRTNTKGIICERWCHTIGCRQWFNIERNTVNHRILRVYPIEEAMRSDLINGGKNK